MNLIYLLLTDSPDIKLFETTINIELDNYTDYYYITDKNSCNTWLIDLKKIKYKNSTTLNLMYLGSIKYKIVLKIIKLKKF